MEPGSWVRVLALLVSVLTAGGLRPRQTIRDYYDPIMHILTLNCTVARVRGESRLSWHRNSQLSDGPKIEASDYTVFIHKNGRKDISAVITVPLPTRVDPDVTDYFSCVLRKGQQQDGLIVTPKAPTKVFLIDRDGNWRNEAFYEGTDLRLRCGTAETRLGVGYHIVPTATITWQRDGRPLPRRARTIPVVLPIGGSGRLVLKNISLEDGGEFSCRARNVFGQGEATRHVHVFKRGEPLQMQTASPVYGLLGESVTLPCHHWSVHPYETETRWFQLNQTSGEPVPLLDYSYSTATCLNGEGGDCDRISAVGVTGRHSGEGSLQIQEARLSDSGTYLCRVDSGNEKRRVSLNRTVQLAVRLQGYTDDIVITEQYNNETRDLLLACSTAFGHPRRQLAWFKNGAPIRGRGVNVRVDGFMERVRNLVGFHSFLKVERLNRGDVYSCQAPHPLTQAMMTTSVTITPPLAKDVAVVPHPEQNPVEFEDLALECKLLVKISPRPNIRWEREGGALPSGVDIRDDVLLVPNAMIEDAGKYKCEAENIFGSAEAEALVHVRSRDTQTSEELMCNTTAAAMDVERCQRRFNHTLELLYRIEQGEHRSQQRLCSIHQELLLCMKRAQASCPTWETSIGIYLNSTNPVKEYCHSPNSQAREENVWSKIFVSVLIFLVVYVF